MVMRLFFLVFCITASSLSSAQVLRYNLDSLLAVLPSLKTDSAKVGTMVRIGMVYKTKNPEKSKEYLLKAYKYPLAFSAQEQGYKTLASTYLARAYSLTGDLESERKWTDISRNHLLNTNDAYAIDLAYEQIGLINLNNANPDSGIYYAQKSISLWDSLKFPERTIRGYYSIANAYYMMKIPAKGIASLRKIFSVAGIKEDGINPVLIPIYKLLSDFYNDMGQYDSVIFYCNKGLPIAYKESNYEAVVDLLNNKANALLGLKSFKSAMELGFKVNSLAKENEYMDILASPARILAICFAHFKQKDSALYYAKQSEFFVRNTTNDPRNVVNMYEMWSVVYEKLANYSMAYNYKDSQYIGYKKMTEAELNEYAITSDTKYQTAKKELEISNLNQAAMQGKRIQWLMAAALMLSLLVAAFAYQSFRSKKKAASILELSNKEKEVFLKEIHHRVKNNLQIISSLLYMQFKDSKDEGIIAQLKQAQERIKSMALVHNKLYEANDVVHVYLKDYISDLAKGILSANTPSNKAINFSIKELHPINLSLDTSISVGLMLNELITNSCKYAFVNKESGNIFVTISTNNNQFLLQVADDGAGLPTNYDQKKSLGIRLVKNMVRQLNGNISFTNNNGTLVNITFSDSIAA